MIASISYLLLYLFLGVVSVRFLLPRHKPLNRIWLGLSLGVLEEMWLPALCAFFLGFTAAAHAAAVALLALITLGCWLLRSGQPTVTSITAKECWTPPRSRRKPSGGFP